MGCDTKDSCVVVWSSFCQWLVGAVSGDLRYSRTRMGPAPACIPQALVSFRHIRRFLLYLTLNVGVGRDRDVEIQRRVECEWGLPVLKLLMFKWYKCCNELTWCIPYVHSGCQAVEGENICSAVFWFACRENTSSKRFEFLTSFICT